jgi:CubicO group peptidase (beta-lactamase class C family)
MSRSLIVSFGFLLCLAALPAAAAPLTWPDTDAAKHARAWFEAFNAGESAMRAVYQEHYSPDALAQRSIETRLGGYRDMKSQQGSLTPIAIREVDDSRIQVVARNAQGETITLGFECQTVAPHRIEGIRVMMGEGGPGGATAAAGPPLDDAAAVEAMQTILTQAAAVDSFSGAVLLARDGKPLLRQAWNRAERRFAVANQPETRFNLGSVNKLFTKVAIAQLAQAGKLSLDDPLTKWLPDWPGKSASKITIAMLAGHRAGITDIFNDRYDAADRSKLRHNRDFIPLFRDEPLWFEPGTSERYSNGSYVLLGEIIAKASGQDYYDYLRDHVWGPAGMSATGYFEADDPTPDLAMGYTRGEDGKAPLHENIFTRPARGSAAGGGYSTLDDLLRFDQALNGDQLCAPGWTGWVIGGPAPAQPQTAAVSGPRMAPSVGFAGGAPGISADYTREGPLTLIVLGNFDPPLTQAVASRLRAILQRMKR